MELFDPVKELPIVRALVHRRCYERATGESVPNAAPLSHYLNTPERRAAA